MAGHCGRAWFLYCTHLTTPRVTLRKYVAGHRVVAPAEFSFTARAVPAQHIRHVAGPRSPSRRSTLADHRGQHVSKSIGSHCENRQNSFSTRVVLG